MKQNLIEKTLKLNTIQNKKGDCVLEQKQSRQLKKQITDNIITTLLEKYDIDIDDFIYSAREFKKTSADD